MTSPTVARIRGQGRVEHVIITQAPRDRPPALYKELMGRAPLLNLLSRGGNLPFPCRFEYRRAASNT